MHDVAYLQDFIIEMFSDLILVCEDVTHELLKVSI